MKRMTPDELKRLVAGAFSARDKDIIRLLCATGVRPSELISIAVDRVDITTGDIQVETLKRRRRGMWRTVRVRDLELLRTMVERARGRGDNRLVPMRRQAVWDLIKRAARRAGIDASRAKPKAIRHAFAIAQIAAGRPLPWIQRRLGHSCLSSTQVYVEEFEDERLEVASCMT